MSQPPPKQSSIDVCGLEPPEPMVRVLDALSLLAADEHLQVLIDREPVPLYNILDRNGYRHTTTPLPDYRFEILIWTPLPPGAAV